MFLSRLKMTKVDTTFEESCFMHELFQIEEEYCNRKAISKVANLPTFPHPPHHILPSHPFLFILKLCETRYHNIEE